MSLLLGNMQQIQSKKSYKAAGGFPQQKTDLPKNNCLCYRPHSIVFCNACGYWIKGRVRHLCPVHPQTVFLCDIGQCPQCKSFEFMLKEI